MVAVVGGLSLQKQERLLSTRPEIIVCTPGRFWELASQGQRHLQNLDRLQYLVVDEADRMVKSGQ